MMKTTPSLDFPDISGLLRPRSIAVIGASDRNGNIGARAIRSMLKLGYKGAIWPVNPRLETLEGLPCFSGPKDLPGVAELAIFAIPAAATAAAVREYAEAGTRAGIVWAGGFAEVGGEGVELQRELVEVCQEFSFMLCGPNCVGIVNQEISMPATFASSLMAVDALRPSTIAMLGQSGGTCQAALGMAYKAGFGFRYMISTGNEAVLTTADYIHALSHDEGTRIIAVYQEGVKNGPKFIAALREARNNGKTVVVIKAGATAASARAAMAHTGALAGEDRAYDAVFREMGVIRVRSLEDLMDTILTLGGISPDKLPKGPRVAVITGGGGSAVLAADQCAEAGLVTPPLDPKTIEKARQLMTPLASLGNPIDLTPDSINNPKWLALMPQALDTIAADPNIDAILWAPGLVAGRSQETIDLMREFRDRCPKPCCFSFRLAPKDVEDRLPAEGIYAASEIARAARALGRIVAHRADLCRPPHQEVADLPEFDWSAFVPNATAGTVVSEHQCHRLLSAAGLSVAAGKLATSVEEAVEVAGAVGYPVALKGISSAVTHRAAAGLLSLDLRSAEEVRGAYRLLAGRASEAGVTLDGIYVQHMVRGGMELLVSAFRDPQFGVMVICGAGGNFTEMLDDVTLERGPVDEELALHMLRRLRLVRYAPHLDKTLDLSVAAKFVSDFSRLAATAPWERFVIEVNPIKWNTEGVAAVDGLLIVEKP
jgi:acetate---CoA ligase (ADP-forming)